MAKLLGECMMSKQETSHLILSLLMVSCSYEFFRVNLEVDTTEINIIMNTNTSSENNESNNNENEENDSSIATKSIIEMYRSRIVRSNWINDQVYDSNLSDLEGMNLRDFCSNFKVGVQRPYCNKICHHSRNKRRVGIFYLKRSSDPNNVLYYEYCKFSLIKYKLWIGCKENSYGGAENSEENIVKL